MTSYNKNNLLAIISALCFLSGGLAYADHRIETMSEPNSVTAMRAVAQNPLSPTYSLPLKYVYHGDANRGGVSVGSIQPIIPVKLGDWNLINQFSLNFIGTPGGVTGIAELPNPYMRKNATEPKGSAGLADSNLTSLLSLGKQGNIFWGVGTSITFPSDAPRRELGSGKFSLGPAAAIVMQTPAWTVGLQASQIWSVFGSAGRKEVSQMLLKPIINYNLEDGWYLSSNMTIVANWNAGSGQEWTVPIGGGVGKVFAIGDYKINARIEGYYNIARPDQAPDWSMGTTLQLMLPDGIL